MSERQGSRLEVYTNSMALFDSQGKEIWRSALTSLDSEGEAEWEGEEGCDQLGCGDGEASEGQDEVAERVKDVFN